MTNNTSDKLLEKDVAEFVISVLLQKNPTLANKTISENSYLVGGLGFDSPDMLEIILAVEDKYDLILHDAVSHECGPTIKSIVDDVMKQKG